MGNAMDYAPPNSLNGTAEISSTSELISKIAETIICQPVLQELEKQEAKLVMDQQKEKTNSNKVKSAVKRIPKFTNRSSRENDKRKRYMRGNFGEDEKEQLKKDDKKRKKSNNNQVIIIIYNLDNNQKEHLRQYEKEIKKVMHVKCNEEKKSM